MLWMRNIVIRFWEFWTPRQIQELRNSKMITCALRMNWPVLSMKAGLITGLKAGMIMPIIQRSSSYSWTVNRLSHFMKQRRIYVKITCKNWYDFYIYLFLVPKLRFLVICYKLYFISPCWINVYFMNLCSFGQQWSLLFVTILVL